MTMSEPAMPARLKLLVGERKVTVFLHDKVAVDLVGEDEDAMPGAHRVEMRKRLVPAKT
jgi:hypothetical protein